MYCKCRIYERGFLSRVGGLDWAGLPLIRLGAGCEEDE